MTREQMIKALRTPAKSVVNSKVPQHPTPLMLAELMLAAADMLEADGMLVQHAQCNQPARIGPETPNAPPTDFHAIILQLVSAAEYFRCVNTEIRDYTTYNGFSERDAEAAIALGWKLLGSITSVQPKVIDERTNY